MKKFLPTVFVLFLSLCIISCNDDEDSPAVVDPVVEVTESDLADDWEMTNIVSTDGEIVAAFTGIPVPVKNNFSAQGTDYDYSAAFTTEPNSVLGQGQYTVEVVVSPPVGGAITESFNLISIPFLDLATWTLDGNTLTTDSLIGSRSVTIISISDTELKIRGELGAIIPLEVIEGIGIEGATIQEISGTATLTFTK